MKKKSALLEDMRENGTICPFGVFPVPFSSFARQVWTFSLKNVVFFVICILHTAFARFNAIYIAPPRGLKSPPEKSVCLTLLVHLYAFQPCTSTGGLAIASLWNEYWSATT